MMETIQLNDLREEVRSMLAICFEGLVSEAEGDPVLTLQNGQTFRFVVQEVK